MGALAIALAAHSEDTPSVYLARLTELLGEGSPLLERIGRAVHSAAMGQETAAFAGDLGLGRGVTGFVNDTVPVVLHAWFRHPHDFRAAIRAVIACGGDTDTTAAILGGIVGSHVGKAGIPNEWLAGLWEWPRTTAWIEGLAQQLADTPSGKRPPPSLLFPAVLLRNGFFLLIVLGHGFRRLLPPY
jgi:ADP-ribosylglycohydrolase